MEIAEITLLLVVVCVSGVLIPGPDTALILRNSVEHGFSSASFTGIGINIGVSIHTAIAIFGIDFLEKNAEIYNLLRYLGAIYIIYLGVSGYREIISAEKGFLADKGFKRKEHRSLTKFLFQGFFCNITNPKAPIFVFAVFSQIIPIGSSVTLKVFYGIEIIMFTLISWIALSKFFNYKTIRAFLLKYQKAISLMADSFFVILGISSFFFTR